MQFLNPWLLFGLIAVAIPIAVHLFNFRRYRKLYFSNVRFLQELKQQTRKQSNLLHRLVLACRILAFVFIVLAFAQPFLAADNSAIVKRSAIISVFLDNSFSMEAQGTSGTLLQEGKDKAREIAAAYQQDDQFQLLTNDFEGRHQRLVSRDEFLNLVSEVEVSPAVRSLSEIAARQADIIRGNNRTSTTVHYLSDFQKSTILKTVPDSTLGKGYLIPLKAASRTNLFIDSCWFGNPVLQLNQQATLTVSITNVSDTRLEKIPVKLKIEGAQRSVASVDIDPGDSREISFSFTNNKPGIYTGEVEINDFPVTYDDIYYFTYTIAEEIRVLCINNEEPDPYITSVYLVDSIVNLTNTPARRTDYSSFAGYRLIILNQLKEISTGMQQEITKYALNGGNVLVIPSLETSPDAMNNLLMNLGTDQFSSVNSSPVKLSEINTTHPLYKEVFEQGSLKSENLDMPLVTKYFSVLPSSQNTAESVLTLANGQPLLTVNSKGTGKVYLFTAPFGDDNGNFARHALFVPTMLNIAFLSENVSPLMYFTDISTPISLNGTFAKSDNVVRLAQMNGDFEFIPEFRQMNGQSYIFINGQVNEAGLYKVISDDREVGVLAFNYNRTESYLATASMDELKGIKKNTGLEIIESSPQPLDKIINEKSAGSKLWKWFIIAALLSLLAETLLLAFFKKRITTV